MTNGRNSDKSARAKWPLSERIERRPKYLTSLAGMLLALCVGCVAPSPGPDAGHSVDSGAAMSPEDAGPLSAVDAGSLGSFDAGSSEDAGLAVDAGGLDGGATYDSGMDDASTEDDAGVTISDGGIDADGGPIDAETDGGSDAGTCGSLGESCCGGRFCHSPLGCVQNLCESVTTRGDGTACSEGSDCASGICLSLATDEKVCTSACSNQYRCISGWSCRSATNEPVNICECRPSEEKCDGIDNDCDGVVDGASANAACAQMYNPSSTCANGKCVCTLVCNGQCFIGATDQQNCGSCGNACTGASVCQGGQCVCPADKLVCNGVCIDPQSDVANCGGCNQECSTTAPSTVACVGGRCITTLADQQLRPYALVVDDTYVYWVNQGDSAGNNSDGSLARIPIVGGTPETLAANLNNPTGIAKDASFLYWTNAATAVAPEGTVMKMPLNGGTPQTLASGLYLPSQIALDSSNVYWINQTAVMGVPLNGGSVFTLGTGTKLSSIAASDAGVFWTDEGSYPAGVGEMVYALLPGNMAPIMIGTGSIHPQGLALDGSAVYWVNQDYDSWTGWVTRSSFDGTSQSMVSTINTRSSFLAVDAVSVYEADTAFLLSKMPLTGGSPVPIAVPKPSEPWWITVDNTSLYWPDLGRIMRATPK